MKYLRAVNQKARRIENHLAASEDDVRALQGPPQQQPPKPHIPLGCSLVFSPGW